MFTGIVEELGVVDGLERLEDAVRLTIRGPLVTGDAGLGDSISVNGCCLTVVGPLVTQDVALGDSISVNGCCLTVAALSTVHPPSSVEPVETPSSVEPVETPTPPNAFTADVMRETLDKTSLGALEPGARVNLERAVTASTRLGGHMVQGHVDATGRILSRRPSEHWEVVEISLPTDLATYVVDKGSICVDGVSLTVVEAGSGSFTVSLIPETLARTTLGHKQSGDLVNLEVDVIAKYVEKMLGAYRPHTKETP